MSPQTRQHAPDEGTEPDTSSTGKTPTSTATGKKPHAIWTSANDETLVTVLEKATEDGERGDNGWKKPAWTAAARALANPSVGGVKSADGCREHWTKQLVKDYNQVHTLITTISGFGWSEERGVVTAEDAVWDELIKSNPRLKKWRTKHFPLFTRIGSLLDGSQAQGKDTVRVPQALPKAASSPRPSNTVGTSRLSKAGAT
ncbi:hypothetical protein K466DRAFT_606798 [Polyporus arcularius HHB13444]|uniref:Myb-like domain-containing protein n=1 Tax=Polyporus arcularius HHB13444 TaxID=1314778 RepID=A0A5C3NN31_9APHY|nr:hypothetical protein K466DRAFT_606798 [Polyporus arcularius HHB13444]